MKDKKAYLREYCRRRRAEQRAAGLCTAIGCQSPPLPGRRRCDRCRRKANWYYNKCLQKKARCADASSTP